MSFGGVLRILAAAVHANGSGNQNCHSVRAIYISTDGVKVPYW